MGTKIKLTESQLKNVVTKLVNEQMIASNQQPANKGSVNVGGKNVGGIPEKPAAPAGPDLSCVGPEDYKIKGQSRNSFKYTTPEGELIFYSDGEIWLWGLNQNKLLKKGKWNCGKNQLEVRWESDPKAVNFQPLPKNYYGKKLDTTKCAQELKDIYNNKFLFFGCKSNAVKELQTMLKMKNVTGYYGNETKTAVSAYQKQNGIKADGIVGRDTYSFLQKTDTTVPKS